MTSFANRNIPRNEFRNNGNDIYRELLTICSRTNDIHDILDIFIAKFELLQFSRSVLTVFSNIIDT